MLPRLQGPTVAPRFADRDRPPLELIQAQAVPPGEDTFERLPAVGPRSTLRAEVDRQMSESRYDPELARLIDDVVHAQPGTAGPLRQEIQERYHRVGDVMGSFALHSALSDVLEDPAMPEDRRQELRRDLSRYALRGGAEGVGSVRTMMMMAAPMMGALGARAPRTPREPVPSATGRAATAPEPFTPPANAPELARRAREFQGRHSPECLDDFLHDYLSARVNRQFGAESTRTSPVPLSYGLGDERRFPTFGQQLDGANAVLRRTTGEELRMVPGQFRSSAEVIRQLETMRLQPGSRGLVIGFDTPGAENHAMRYVIGTEGRPRIEGAMGMVHQNFGIYVPTGVR